MADPSITANLIIHHNFDALLFEFDDNAVKQATEFYSRNIDTGLRQPQIVKAWVTRDNINDLILDNRFSAEIDLLVIDVNGVDYWLWEHINVIDPRVVVIECNTLWPPDTAVTIPNKTDFWRFDYNPRYFGCSALAAVKLGKRKDYRLVAANNLGHNLVFVKENIINDIMPELKPEEFLNKRNLNVARDQHLQEIEKYEWVEV